MLRKIEGRLRGETEDKMVGWHYWLNGYEFEQTQGDSEGQGSLACYSPWDCRAGHKWPTEPKQQQAVINNVILVLEHLHWATPSIFYRNSCFLYPRILRSLTVASKFLCSQHCTYRSPRINVGLSYLSETSEVWHILGFTLLLISGW